MPKKFFLFLAVLCLLAAPSIAQAATGSLIGSACDNVGTTRLDTNEENIVACLKTATGAKVWKGTASESFNESTMVSGYQKLPSGLILQWVRGPMFKVENTTSADPNMWSKDVIFPIPFPNKCLHVQVSAFFDYNQQYAGFLGSSPIFSGINTADDVWFQVASYDRWGADIFIQRSGGMQHFVWPLVFAIGY